MAFNWETFCQSHRISYVTEGSSWTPGNINIHCPFCGSDDPGNHMGLHLRTGYWHCWRNNSHAGKAPHRLIQKLIGCNYSQAVALVGEGTHRDLEGFEAAAAQFLAGDDRSGSHEVLSFPREFKPLRNRKGRARIYFEYLISRGFPSRDIVDLCSIYDIHYADRGPFRGRIILPFYINEKLVSWVGRTVYPVEPIRYKILSHKPEAEPRALVDRNELLYNFDEVMDVEGSWEAGVIVEGPLDVLKLDFYGHPHICAVATMGTSISDEQVAGILQLADRCDKLYIAQEVGAGASQFKLHSDLVECELLDLPLPDGVEDPGALSEKQVRRLVKKIRGVS